ncbi:MAG: hypothetical protein PF485_08990 [Bacteroidales bacterium]|jgi:hypothetical protein|nr:hypothetical protein [Bacteroidales bacterium]
MSYYVKRKLSEVLFMYSVEPELKDVYVEGITDKLCFEEVLLDNEINFKEIDSIDFSELYTEDPSLKRNNRKKIVALSEKLSLSFHNNLKYVSCIADLDYDYFSDVVSWNYYLHYTDYASMELYLFNEPTLDHFFNNILHGFPFSSSIVIQSLSDALVNLFFVRLSIKRLFEDAGNEITFVELKRSIAIVKDTGEITFNPLDYIQKLLNSNNLNAKYQLVVDYFNQISSNRSIENRVQIRGHDFIYLFYILVDKVKNSTRINEDTLDRVLQVCICKETLMKKMQYKYSA